MSLNGLRFRCLGLRRDVMEFIREEEFKMRHAIKSKGKDQEPDKITEPGCE